MFLGSAIASAKLETKLATVAKTQLQVKVIHVPGERKEELAITLEVYTKYEITMTAMGRIWTMLMIVVVLVAIVESRPYRISHQRTLRLCSKSLSDALWLACRENGFNEPYIGEVSHGPGLVDECCYHSCSFEQLQQYCKPAPEEKRGATEDAIDDSFSEMNVPYASARRELSSEERSRTTFNEIGDAKKCKRRGTRIGGRKLRHDRDEIKKNDGKQRKERKRDRHSVCQRRRRRRRLGKNSRETVVTEIPGAEMRKTDTGSDR